VSEVALGDDEFSGPEADLMPDLLVHWRNDLRITRLIGAGGAVIERPDAPEVPFGAHHPHGTLLASGPSFRALDAQQTHSIYDIAPTLMHLLGLPVPSHFDGRVMGELMTPAAAKDVRRESVNVSTVGQNPCVRADDVVTERLRSLGYLE
jgi:predicted AlkP superfamily phosphohydrolase/phosphomutase